MDTVYDHTDFSQIGHFLSRKSNAFDRLKQEARSWVTEYKIGTFIIPLIVYEKCFYCQMYVDKVHATIITPPIEETIDGWISEYYDSDETENTSLFEFMCTKIKQVVLIDG